MRSIAVMVLTSTLAMPLVSVAGPRQDRNHDERKDATQEHRVYDKAHHDYHVWDNREEQLYRQYADEHHLRDREYAKLSAKQQKEYWNWRHQHERDHDRR